MSSVIQSGTFYVLLMVMEGGGCSLCAVCHPPPCCELTLHLEGFALKQQNEWASIGFVQ